MTEGETVAVTNGVGEGSGEGAANPNSSTISEPDPHFEPIVQLPEVAVPTMEEEEEEMIKLRAKLFRFDSSETPSEWKDRGTGEVKLLRHLSKNTVRVVMRRDKTLKICANHFVTPWMELTSNCGSDRAWVWSSEADYADETPRPELLAIRFATAEIAQKWKEKFEEAKSFVAEQVLKNQPEEDENSSENEDANGSSISKENKDSNSEATAEVTEQLEKLVVMDKNIAEDCKPISKPQKE